MFRTSKYHAVHGDRLVASTNTRRSAQSTQNDHHVARGKVQITASSFLNPFVGGAMPNSTMSVSSINGGQNDLMLTGLLQTSDENMLRRYYRDIYYHDPVCGSVADMMASFPFSEFMLGGLPENELEVYESATSRLNLRNALPEMTLDYLVDGTHASMLVYDDQKKNFSNFIPFDMDCVTVKESPLYSMDPELKVLNSTAAIRNFQTEDSEYFRRQRKSLPKKLLAALDAEAFISDPLTTLYLARNIFPRRKIGISLFKRVLPIYLLEKTLWRGTLVEAAKRLRAMRHITAGDDIWEPTPEDLNAMVAALQEAEMDPLGGIMATRNSVSISEISNGGDFWKITDIVDSTTPMKLRAMGTSEGFLSGESVYSNAEASINSFMESEEWFRSMMTHKILYNKIFPIIAHENDFVRDQSAHKNTTLDSLNDVTNYRIPVVHWFKQLHPNSDSSMMETLETMEEKGVPVTLRAYAAAGGVSLDSLLRDQKEDAELRSKLEKLRGSPEGQGSGGEEDDFSLSGYRRRPQSLLSRDFGSSGEITARTRTGKLKYVHNQRAANRSANDAIVKACTALKDPEHRRRVRQRAGTRNLYTGGNFQ